LKLIEIKLLTVNNWNLNCYLKPIAIPSEHFEIVWFEQKF